MKTIKSITRADMADIALGGAFLGTGGGGDPYIGRLMAEQAIDQHGPSLSLMSIVSTMMHLWCQYV